MFVITYSYVSTTQEEIHLTTLTLVNRKKLSVTFHQMGKLHLYTKYSTCMSVNFIIYSEHIYL